MEHYIYIHLQYMNLLFLLFFSFSHDPFFFLHSRHVPFFSFHFPPFLRLFPILLSFHFPVCSCQLFFLVFEFSFLPACYYNDLFRFRPFFFILHVVILSLPSIFLEFSRHRFRKKATAPFLGSTEVSIIVLHSERTGIVRWLPCHRESMHFSTCLTPQKHEL